MVIINGFLYVFGGTTGYIYSTDLHRLDLTAREWIHLKPNNPPDDLPEERYNVMIHECAIGSNQARGVMRAVKTFNMVCVCHRYRHEIAHDGQRIYILGGGTSWTSYPLDKVPLYPTRVESLKRSKSPNVCTSHIVSVQNSSKWHF